MYDIFGYGSMIADRTRMGAYETALRRAITPGCIVADLGTGTGMMAMMAARMGAAKVYAIEPGDLIQVGRECARANGLADRIEFIQDISTKVSLTCQVDVIVSDMRGVLPLHHSHLASIADARRRFLKPVGVLIPQQD